MDALISLLEPWISGGASLQIAIVLLVGAVFGFFVLGIAYLFFGGMNPVRRRLRDATDTEDHQLPNGTENPKSYFNVTLDTILGPVSRYILPGNELERSRIKLKLQYAGFKQPNAMQTFYTIKTGLAISLPLLVYVVGSYYPQVSLEMLLWYTLMGSGVGLLVPNMVLERLKERRLKALRNGFPDALDLLVVCVESGLGIAQAIQRVGNELEVSHPELAEELMMVNAEVRAGVDRVTALKNLSIRTGLEDIRGLVSLLVQTMRFGTSIADSLRIYAEEFRDKRMQGAEEMAAKLGTKLIFPLVLFLFPAFFVVSVGPAMIKVFAAFSG